MRKLLIAVVIVILVVVGIVFIVPMLVDVNQYRGQIQAELQKRLNRPVQLGDMSLSVIPLAVKVDNVTIGDDPSFHSNVPFAQVQQLDVHVEAVSPAGQEHRGEQPHPGEAQDRADPQRGRHLELRQPGTEDRQPHPQSRSAPSQPSLAAQPGAQPAGFELSKLSINDGQIAVTDYQKHQPRAVYDHIDLTLEGLTRRTSRSRSMSQRICPATEADAGTQRARAGRSIARSS